MTYGSIDMDQEGNTFLPTGCDRSNFVGGFFFKTICGEIVGGFPYETQNLAYTGALPNGCNS